MGMGLCGWMEPHPFTIASVAEVRRSMQVVGMFGRCTDRELLKSADGEGLTLICKNTGDWTDKLYSLAQGGAKDSEAHGGRNVTVLVDGPYGT